MMQRESLDPTTDLKISVEYLGERSTIVLDDCSILTEVFPLLFLLFHLLLELSRQLFYFSLRFGGPLQEINHIPRCDRSGDK